MQIQIPYFNKFQCGICRRPVKLARYAKSKLSYLCDDKKCLYISDISSGWINLNITIPEK